MLKNYIKIAWRNLIHNKIYSSINIGGLAVGMAVAILIGLWINNELSFNKYHENYDRIVRVMQHNNYNGKISTQISNPAVMAEEIRNLHGSDFKYVLQSSWNNDKTLRYQDKIFTKSGSYFEPEVIDMLSLDVIKGNKDGLQEMSSIMLSESVAIAFFGDEDPIGKLLKLENKDNVKVTGVYKDIPISSSFNAVSFLLPWDLYLSQNPRIEKMERPWGSNFTQTFAQVGENADIEKVSQKIKDVKLDQVSDGERKFNPQVFLHAMPLWHLHSNFESGVNTGGRIDTIWLFFIIGVFVLLLACINFMNLSTARSEKRAKEVGIRKAIGSNRKLLITQFFTESILIAMLAFSFSILLVILILPFFNNIAESEIVILWENPLFWLIGIGFSILTGLFAGIYPALYLSSFNPVKVLKGTFKVGRFAAIPRKVLVVSQFAISIVLIIGTIVVYKQVNHAQNRILGYEKDGLLMVDTNEETHKHLEAIATDLKSQGAILEITESTSPITAVYNTNGGIEWEGKDPNLAVDFPNNAVTHEYGATIQWTIKEGRDFSKDFKADSSGFIINESAADFIGFDDPIGKTLRWDDQPFTIIGVVEDMLVQSPYKPVRPSLFHLLDSRENVFLIKMNPEKSVQESLSKIKTVFNKFNPEIPFVAEFADAEFAKKFGNERRIGKLALFFTILAIFISCLGLFGLASYVAEQRTKEIGIRKVLGATVLKIWEMLSKDFVLLVFIACLISIPIAYLIMDKWLEKFDYHTAIPWWIFGIACLGALVITLITVSYQAINAARANPVNSLKSE